MTKRPRRAGWVALAVATALHAAPALAKDWSHLRVASEGAHPPFNYFDAEKQLQGFDIDIAREVCRRIKAQCEFVTQDFVGLIPALIAGRYDVVFASLLATDDRSRLVLFSNKYYDTRLMFVTTKSKTLASIAPTDAKGLRIGAKLGSASARYLSDVYAPQGAVIKLYVTQDEARLDLSDGRIDALIGDKTALLYWLEKDPLAKCCRIIGDDVAIDRYIGRGVAAAMRKGDGDLKALIDGAIDGMRRDGAYDAIRKKYFSFDPY